MSFNGKETMILAAGCTPEYFEETINILRGNGGYIPGRDVDRDVVVIILACSAIGMMDALMETGLIEDPRNDEAKGIFWHECMAPGCARSVEFDDEPKCFTHSPDEGSSMPGYSARAEAGL